MSNECWARMQGDVLEVECCADTYYVDTGMYDVAEYGSVYLLDAEQPALVDTGVGTNHGRILDMLDEVGVAKTDLTHILLTHVHLDHAGGAGFLAEECPNATIYVYENATHHLRDPSRIIEGTKQALGDQWNYHAEPRPIPEGRIVGLRDGDTIDLGDRLLEAHHAPGHAPHQVVFDDRLNNAVFVADAAGVWIPSMETIYTPSPPPNFDLKQVLEDTEMITDLNPEVLLFPHYGPGPTDVQGVLADYRVAMVEWVNAVEAKYEALGHEADVVDYFVSRNEVHKAWGTERAEADTALNVSGALQYLTSHDG